MNNPINARMIILARESRGLTQAQLADKLGISQGKISKIEQGFISAADDILSKLSEILKYPAQFFTEQTPLYPVVSYHRKRQSLGKKVLDNIDANISIRQLHLKRLLEAVEIPSRIPFIDIRNENQSPIEIARYVRNHWHLPKGPIQNLTEVLENNGGIVIDFDFGSNLIDGLSVWVHELPPVFFVNPNIPGDRMRFTLAHELGHVVMHDLPTDTVESEADLFAAEFLMPESDIRPYLTPRIGLEKLADLKRYWKVSMAALIKRASTLDVLTERQSRYLWMQMGTYGYRQHEPINVPREKPGILQELIDTYFKRLGYSISELSKVLCLNTDEFTEFYVNSHLKLIKQPS